MEWWGVLLVTVGAGLVLGFWGWVAVKIISLDKEVAGLKGGRLDQTEDRRELLAWFTRIEATQNDMNQRLARMEGGQNRKEPQR